MTKEDRDTLDALCLPKGWEIKDREAAVRELRRLDGIIEIVRCRRWNWLFFLG